MMHISPKRHLDQINTLAQVWAALSPDTSFSGVTLREVVARFQPSLDSRARIAAAQVELAAAIHEREIADEATFKFYKRALCAIKADPNEAEGTGLLTAVSSARRKVRRRGPISNALPPLTELKVVQPAA